MLTEVFGAVACLGSRASIVAAVYDSSYTNYAGRLLHQASEMAMVDKYGSTYIPPTTPGDALPSSNCLKSVALR